MNCLNCGTPLSPDDRFCPNCGTPAPQQPIPQIPQPQQSPPEIPQPVQQGWTQPVQEHRPEKKGPHIDLLNPYVWIICVGMGLMIAAALLPYLSYSYSVELYGFTQTGSETIRLLTQGDGIILIVLAAAAAVCAAFALRIPAVVLGGVSAAVVIYEAVTYEKGIRDAQLTLQAAFSSLGQYTDISQYVNMIFNRGTGYFMMIAAGVVLLLGTVLDLVLPNPFEKKKKAPEAPAPMNPMY